MATSDFTGTQHTGWGNTGHNPITGSDFRRLGHPGKYYSVLRHHGGITNFTGENYGYGAIQIVGSGSGFVEGDKISLSGGGDILLRDLVGASSSSLDIIDISLAQISSSVGTPVIYCYKKQ